MFIKYCELCQMNNHKKLDKCPTEMQPVKVPQHAWKQIGKIFIYQFPTKRSAYLHYTRIMFKIKL